VDTQGTQDILKFSLSFITGGGYLAVGLILLAISYFMQNQWKAAKWACGSAGFVLLLTFAVLNILSTQFPDILVDRANISVAVTRALIDDQVDLDVGNDQATPPFVRKENDKRDRSRARYYFIASRRSGQYSCLTLAIATPSTLGTTSGLRKESLFSIPVDDQDVAARREIDLTIVREQDGTINVWVERQDGGRPIGVKQTIAPIAIPNVASCQEIQAPQGHAGTTTRRSWGFSFLNVASAETPPPPQRPEAITTVCMSYLTRFRSDDTILRRKTRNSLPLEGDATIPIIQRLIYHPDYRVQLGALVALAGFVDMNPQASLPGNIVRRVEALKTSSDPTLRNAASEALKASTSTPSSFTELPSVLWADDNPENNQREADTLRCDGARVVQVSSTDKALAALSGAAWDLMISDMGEGAQPSAGLILLQTIRDRGLQVPFVFYSTEQSKQRFGPAAEALNAKFTTRSDDILTAATLALHLSPEAQRP
jgi:CheY-like chemotaxis protein